MTCWWPTALATPPSARRSPGAALTWTRGAPADRPPRVGPSGLCGEYAVDLADRQPHALFHAHVEHLRQLLGAGEGGHRGHPGAGAGRLDGHRGVRDVGRVERFAVVTGEAVVELQPVRRVD